MVPRISQTVIIILLYSFTFPGTYVHTEEISGNRFSPASAVEEEVSREISPGEGEDAGDVNLFPVKKDGKWGYMDITGSIVISPQFESASSFSEGLAVVKQGSWCNYVNCKGEVVISCGADLASSFSCGLALIAYSGLRDPYLCANIFSVGIGHMGLDYDRFFFHFIDRDGEWINYIPYGWAMSFSDGVAHVWDNVPEPVLFPYKHWHPKHSKRGFIDIEGEWVLELKGYYIGSFFFSEGLLPVSMDDRYGYVNKTGVLVIPLAFDDASSFSEGLAAVKTGGKWGFIDKDGELIIDPAYDNAKEFSESIAAVQIDDKWGFIDRSGQYVIKPSFVEVGSFSEGFAEVLVAEKWGFIDSDGVIVVEPKFDHVEQFFNGLAMVGFGDEKMEKFGYIDKTGAYVWEPTN